MILHSQRGGGGGRRPGRGRMQLIKCPSGWERNSWPHLHFSSLILKLLSLLSLSLRPDMRTTTREAQRFACLLVSSRTLSQSSLEETH